MTWWHQCCVKTTSAVLFQNLAIIRSQPATYPGITRTDAHIFRLDWMKNLGQAMCSCRQILPARPTTLLEKITDPEIANPPWGRAAYRLEAGISCQFAITRIPRITELCKRFLATGELAPKFSLSGRLLP